MNFEREEQRYEYDLNPRSQILDIGCYHGQWSRKIADRYNCYIEAFEPIPEFRAIIRATMSGYPKFTLNPYAIATTECTKTFTVKGDMTGEFVGDATAENYELSVACTPAFNLTRCTFDLVKINCEGGEFDILEELLRHNHAANWTHIQVQPHTVVPNWEERWAKIEEGLSETHELTWGTPWVWQNWSKR